MWSFQRWRQQHIVQQYSIDAAGWAHAFEKLPIAQGLSIEQHQTLCQRSLVFLHDKHLNCVEDLSQPPLEECLHLALQAQLPLLELPDLNWYQNVHEFVLYPAPFHSPQQHHESDGVVRMRDEQRSGETWLQGPVVLSWPQVLEGGGWTGRNLVIHELAHKLDLLNGSADGFPPLHADMLISDWTHAFQKAFQHLRHRIQKNTRGFINPYAAENPAEFFAVTTEYFFSAPHVLNLHCPEVYQQLRLFYRQDTLARWQQQHLQEHP